MNSAVIPLNNVRKALATERMKEAVEMGATPREAYESEMLNGQATEH